MMPTLCQPLVPLMPSVAAIIASICVTSVPPQDAAAPRPAATTLARPSSAPAAPDAEGCVRRRLLREPIPVSGQLTQSAVRDAVTKDYFSNQLTVLPHDGDTVTAANASLTWHALDTINYDVNLFRFAHALGQPTCGATDFCARVLDAGDRPVKTISVSLPR